MKYVILTAITLSLASCSPQIQVYSDHDPDYQVRNFSTFDWGQKVNIEDDKHPLHYNEMNDKRIKAAILEELTSRGYYRSEASPELIVHYHIVVDDRSIVTTEPYGYLYGPYWMQMRTNVYSYREGTLIIDLMDPTKKHLIWRGWATADLNTITPDRTREIINLAVAKIFRRFPHSVKAQEPVVSNIESNRIHQLAQP